MPAQNNSLDTPFFSVDATWLHMDAPCNRVTIVGLGLYDQPMKYQHLRAVVEDRLLRFDRFRQRVRESHRPLGLPAWEPDPNFDLDKHLWHIRLPSPGDWGVLLRLVEKLMQVPLPADRPLWRMILVDRFGSGSAMIMCMSHAVADGAAILHVLNTLTGPTARASLARLAPEPHCPEEDHGRAAQIVRALDQASRVLAAPGALLNRGLDAARDPLGTVLRGADVGRALGKLLFIPPDHHTALSGRCGPAKRAVTCDPIPLTRVKAVGRPFGAKVNDVVLAAVTGSLREYLRARGEPVSGLNLRAMVPVYLNPWHDEADLRNGFGLVFLSLPVGIADPVRRLRVLKGRMDKIKTSPEAAVAYGIMHGLGYTPPALERLIARGFAMKATAVMTNVMGPTKPCYIAGVKTSRILFWVPQPAGLGIGVSLISYAGELTVTLATDAALVPDPEVIATGFQEQFKQLARLGDLASRKARAAAPPRARPAARSNGHAKAQGKGRGQAKAKGRTAAPRRKPVPVPA